jgi:O-antigen biosynthesis protein
MKLSIIVPPYNSYDTVKKTLGSLMSQCDFSEDEIIVVDASSDGKTRKYMETFKEKISLYYMNPAATPADARNLGAEKAKGEILAFVDSDVYVAPDWVAKIKEEYKCGHEAGGGPVLIAEHQKNNPVALAQWFLQYGQHLQTIKQEEKAVWPSVHMYCSKELFNRVGGFPKIRASEDYLFSYKLAKIGKKFSYCPQIKAHHIFREKMLLYLNNQIMLGRYQMIAKKYALKSAFYRNPMLPLLYPVIFPALIIVKSFSKLCGVVKSEKPTIIIKFFLSYPLFFMGAVVWAYGFMKGFFEKMNIQGYENNF